MTKKNETTNSGLTCITCGKKIMVPVNQYQYENEYGNQMNGYDFGDVIAFWFTSFYTEADQQGISYNYSSEEMVEDTAICEECLSNLSGIFKNKDLSMISNLQQQVNHLKRRLFDLHNKLSRLQRKADTFDWLLMIREKGLEDKGMKPGYYERRILKILDKRIQ